MLSLQKRKKMKKKQRFKNLTVDLTNQLTREMQMQRLIVQDNLFPISKKMELRQRLRRYNANFIKGRLISISLENLESLKRYDPDTLELAIDLKYSWQIKIEL